MRTNNLWHLRNKMKSNCNPSRKNKWKETFTSLFIPAINSIKKYTISLYPAVCEPLYNLYNVQSSATEQRLRIVKFILWIFVHWSFILLAENLFILHFVFYTNDSLHFPVAISLLDGWGPGPYIDIDIEERS